MMRPSKTRLLIANLLLWSTILGLIFVAVGLVILEASPDLNAWHIWMDTNKAALTTWRLVIYSATAGFWYRMRRRLALRDLSADQHSRLLLAETSAISVLVLIEWSIWTTDYQLRPSP